MTQKDLLLPSLLDRLLDDRPEATQDSDISYQHLGSIIETSLLRDLEMLLNTRSAFWRGFSTPTSPVTSVIEYGSPNLMQNQLQVTNDEKQNICEALEKIIVQYEPRFHRVSVSLKEAASGGDPRRLIFQIDAWMSVEPMPERMVFTSKLDVANGRFSVRS